MWMAESWPPSVNLLMSNPMKNSYPNSILSLLLLTAFILATACSVNEAEFIITNTSENDRDDEPIILTRQQIIERSGEIPLMEGQLPLPHNNGEPIPAQLDDMNMDGEWDELAFTLDLAAGETKNIVLQFVDVNEYPQFDTRTNVRFGVLDAGQVHPVTQLSLTDQELPVPLFERFQMDGPAWENDKVGFRQYIDGRNGRDFFGKTSPSMALDTVGIADDSTLEDNYHEMLPWGRDILAVGNSLGLGGLAIINNGEPVRLGITFEDEKNNIELTSYELITEGPVRSSFRITYTGWNTGDDKIDLINTVTIWAGHYGHTNKVTLQKSGAMDTLAVGLVNIHNDNEPVILTGDGYNAFYTHDQQTYDKQWYLGMGLVFPNENYLEYTEAPESGEGITNSYLLLFEMEEQQPLEYFVFAGWELSDEQFADPNYFNQFMDAQIYKMDHPVEVK